MSVTVLKPDPYDPAWREFCDELSYCLEVSSCTRRHHFATLLLERRGHDVEASLELFEARGGYCDCEILLNVDQPTLEDELDWILGVER